MVKHIIVWKLKDEITDKNEVKSKIKRELEGLVEKIEGLTEMKILTEGFDSSSGDLMMDSTFESNDALKGYQKSPFHVRVIGTIRTCFLQSDFRSSFVKILANPTRIGCVFALADQKSDCRKSLT